MPWALWTLFPLSPLYLFLNQTSPMVNCRYSILSMIENSCWFDWIHNEESSKEINANNLWRKCEWKKNWMGTENFQKLKSILNSFAMLILRTMGIVLHIVYTTHILQFHWYLGCFIHKYCDFADQLCIWVVLSICNMFNYRVLNIEWHKIYLVRILNILNRILKHYI